MWGTIITPSFMNNSQVQKSRFNSPEGIQYKDIKKGRPPSVVAALEEQERIVWLAIRGWCNAKNPRYSENQRPAGWASAAE